MTILQTRYLPIAIIFLVCILQPILSANNHFIKVTYCVGKAFWSCDGRSPFVLSKSRFDFDTRGKILTYSDGQLVCNYNKDSQLRLKENSIVKTSLVNCFTVTKGTVGFKTNLGSKLFIKALHLEVKLYENSIVTVKVNPLITRLCVVRGKALAFKNDKIIVVNAGCEIAASKNKLSTLYKQTNELRYTWYWTTADKEPSFN